MRENTEEKGVHKHAWRPQPQRSGRRLRKGPGEGPSGGFNLSECFVFFIKNVSESNLLVQLLPLHLFFRYMETFFFCLIDHFPLDAFSSLLDPSLPPAAESTSIPKLVFTLRSCGYPQAGAIALFF